MDITTDDQKFLTTAQASELGNKLAETLEPFDLARGRLSRLMRADEGELGGWPDGFEFPDQALATYALLSDTLESEAEQMLQWAKLMRELSAYLWNTHGPRIEAHA